MSKSGNQRRYLLSHAVLRSFECAARHESFTLAAEELHLTQSAISRQVKELEDVIGTDLFSRIGRRVALTEAGKNLAGELAIDLESIRQTVMRAVSAGALGAVIRVAVLPDFASRWLIPRLPEFMALHNDIEISFATRLEPFDMVREHFDLAIHFGTDNWPGAEMELFCTETMVAVASPAFMERYKFESTKDLLNAPLLHMENRPMVWRDFFMQAKIENEAVFAGKYFDQFSMVIAGAIASLGAALVPTYLIERELSDGSLVQLDKASVTTKNNYYLVKPANSKSRHVTLFTDWMKENVGT